ncbi:DUF4190 domain-containing protein [Skermania sp. ID1734]|uniref:DUF4190 domain-containing protein n=1 Tax=Skermania sp. ID1734 TaxID=2597516 RepID=UPI00163D7758|nr:DUF4190 domain-containing protein [Skermania sp. ID1734]
MERYPGAPPYRERRALNGMSVVAIVSSLLIPPLGIAFGHLSLRQIKRTGSAGRGLSTAALAFGYLFTVLGIAVLLLAFTVTARIVVHTGANPSIAITRPSADPLGTGKAIRSTTPGSCIHREPNDSTTVRIESVSCDSAEATDRVTASTDDIGGCLGDWVRTTNPSRNPETVVLCLTPK